MPELPDIEAYVRALRPRTVGRTLQRVRLTSLFVLRTVTPSPADAAGRAVTAVRRLGKRVVLELEGELYLALHLMIAGRLQWRGPDAKAGAALAAFDFEHGTLLLTEAGSKRRAALHLLQGEAALRELDAGGLEVLESDAAAFEETLRRESHTLKRTLTDPHLFSGIGNAYSDEILHRARLSPVKLTRRLTDEECLRLYDAARTVLTEWSERLASENGDRFPERVTAFRPEMAVHGRYGHPCPACAGPVQRIVYAENECNYCPACQTEGRLLADRAFSRLLREDWPRTLAELEERFRVQREERPPPPACGKQEG